MMMKYILIENKGEIDVNALVLMGGSTKRDSTTAIGLFGSGNKYSIALLIKNQIGFRVFSGEKEIEISTKTVQFRDKTFDQILIDGKETSLTTDMGPQWTSWMAIREFVSNSIDEGESNIVSEAVDINPKAGYTRIYVEHHDDIKEVIKNWNKYFSFDRIDAILDIDGQKIYLNTDTEKESLLLYRKGIQCYHMISQKALYSYDLPQFQINESRVLSDTWDSRRQICKFLISNITKEVATNILSNAQRGNQYYEGKLEWYTWLGSSMTGGLCQQWRDAIGDHIIINYNATGFYTKEMGEHKYYIVSRELAKAIKRSFPEVPVYGVGQDSEDELNWRIVEHTTKMDYLLKKADEFCRETKYNINYPIQVVEFDKQDILGRACEKKILVAAKVFDMGMKELLMTLIEENEHLNTGYKDETREWANHFIRMFLTEKEERFGIFL